MNRIASCILSVTVGFLIIGCGGRDTNGTLVYADSLIKQHQDDSAMNVLTRISPEELKDEGDTAYYNLLMTQVRYRLYLPPLQDSTMINNSIEYFKGKDYEMLARAYYYKGVTDEERGNMKSAIISLKNAENMLEDINDEDFKNYIIESIAFINFRNDEYSLALEYGKKTLKLAQKRNNKTDIAYALNIIGLAYSELGKQDSAYYYMMQIIPYLKDIREKERAALLNNIYAHSKDYQRNKTIEYLKASYKIDSNSVACSNLARYYYKIGMKEESDKMWELALKDTSLDARIKYTKGLMEQREEEGKYQDVGELSKKLLVLSDSLKYKQQEDKIKDLQTEYDKRIEQKKAENDTKLLACIVIILTLTVALVAVYNKVKAGKATALLAEKRLQAQAYKEKIAELEASGSKDKGSIEEMKRVLGKLNEKHAQTLSRGKELYEHIKSGGTIVKWNKTDLIDYIDFYWSVDMVFVSDMRMGYDKISPRYQLFMILQHLDYNDEEIMRIMGIGKSTVRSIRTRIKKAKKR